MQNNGNKKIRTKATKSTTKMEEKTTSLVGAMMILKLQEKSHLETITKEAISSAYRW